MKKVLFPLLAIFFVMESCKSAKPHGFRFDNATLISVECTNEAGIRQFVLLKLRSAKAKDIVVKNNGKFLGITASLLNQETPMFRMESMAQELRDTPGVVQVLLDENKKAIRQSF
jgi:hypothetical protein